MSRLDGPRRRTLLMAAALGLIISAVLPATEAFASASSTLTAGQNLAAGASLTSPSGTFKATMQGDGNFVEYGPTGPIWASGTSDIGDGAQLVMQGDGNLVLYRASGSAAWASKTNPSSDDRLFLQDDGNLVIYAGSGAALWGDNGNRPTTLFSTGTLTAGNALYSSTGGFQAVMQDDGNFVVYGPSGALWSSNTANTGADNSLTMQGDGNLVIYQSNGHAVWGSGTNPSNNDQLVMQGDGNLVLYEGVGRALWASNTSGGTGSMDAVAAFEKKYMNAKVGAGQCVDLFNAYNSEVVKAVAIHPRSAYQIWDQASAKYTRIAASATPQAGDVAVFAASSWFGSDGHVAIVLRSVSSSTVHVFDQNYPRDDKSNEDDLPTKYLRGYLRPNV